MSNKDQLNFESYKEESELRKLLLNRIDELNISIENLLQNQNYLIQLLKEIIDSHIDLLKINNMNEIANKWNIIKESLCVGKNNASQ